MTDVIKRKPGRPRKARPVEVVQTEGETPATVVRPVADPGHDPNPVSEVGIDPFNAVEGGADDDALRGEAEAVASIFGPSGGPDSGEVAETVVLSPSALEAAKNVYSIPEGVGLEVPDIQEESPAELSPAQTVALDRDFDGEAGGSRPHAKLSEHQVKAYVQNAIDAYEGQFEVKAVDSFNRVWSFRHETVKSQDHMLIECRRGPTVAQRLISSAIFTQGQAMVAVEGCDAETKQ